MQWKCKFECQQNVRSIHSSFTLLNPLLTYLLTALSVFQKRAKAQTLLDKVFEHLELVEKDYFGLQFADVGSSPDALVSHHVEEAQNICPDPLKSRMLSKLCIVCFTKTTPIFALKLATFLNHEIFFFWLIGCFWTQIFFKFLHCTVDGKVVYSL